MKQFEFYGSGGGSSGGDFKQRPDNLRSEDSLEALIGLCAGPIKGLVRGLKSLNVNGTPVENETGELNFPDLTTFFADGDPGKFPQIAKLRLGSGASPIPVSLGITNSSATAPGPWVTRTLNVQGADFIDLRFVISQLYRQDKSGVFEETANLEIQMKPVGSTNWINPNLDNPTTTYNQNGTTYANLRLYTPEAYYGDDGYWMPEANSGYLSVSGKTSSPYIYELRVNVPNENAYANTGWDIRIRLIEVDTVDADPVLVKRTIQWESLAAVFSSELGAAEGWRGLSWLQIYSKATNQLTGTPDIDGIYDTKIVQVPPSSVFNPETRTYTGATWDGSWVNSYTNDPAWVINNALSDSISGLSVIASGARLNKWDALEASKWFGAQVPDGAGGTEPRSSLNVAITEAQKGDDFIRYLAGAVGGFAWDSGNGEWRMKIDKPANAVDIFTADNIYGDFVWSHTDVDTRFNDIKMTFLNEEMDFRQDFVQVYDNASIALYGRKPTSLVAVGCTGRQEALRRAMLRLRTCINETRMVSFTTNRRGKVLEPFNNILIADKDLGNNTTGRLLSISTDRKTVTVRDPMRLEVGVAYSLRFAYRNPDYAPDSSVAPTSPDWMLPTLTTTRVVANAAGERGDVVTIKLTSPLPADVAEYLTVALEATNLPTIPRLCKIVELKPNDDGETITITAIQVDTGKWDAADNVSPSDSVLQAPSAIVPPPIMPASGNIMTVVGTELSFNWGRPASTFIQGFSVRYSVNGGPIQTLETLTSELTATLVRPAEGEYTAQIYTIDRRGGLSLPITSTLSVPFFEINADNVSYDDGQTAEDLKPATPGATSGAPAGTNVAGRPAEQVLTDIDDLFDTYGDTASAAASASAAQGFANTAEAAAANSGIARDQAQDAFDAADLARIASQTASTSASGSAGAAAGSAGAALVSENNAGSWAQAAQVSEVSARAGASFTFPRGFTPGERQFWTYQEQAAPADAIAFDAGWYSGNNFQTLPGQTFALANRGTFKPVIGRKYRMTVSVRRIQNASNGVISTFYPGFGGSKPDGSYAGFVGYDELGETGDGLAWTLNEWKTLTYTWTCDQEMQFLRGRVHFNWNNSLGVGPFSDAIYQMRSLVTEDVTDSELSRGYSSSSASHADTAAASANDAGESASAAHTSETNAATSAGHASTSESNASTSETNAAGSANTASIKADLAAGSASAAGGSAGAAAGSAGVASTKADEAGNSATSALASKVSAESARDVTKGIQDRNFPPTLDPQSSLSYIIAWNAAPGAPTVLGPAPVTSGWPQPYAVYSSAPGTNNYVYFLKTKPSIVGRRYRATGWAYHTGTQSKHYAHMYWQGGNTDDRSGIVDSRVGVTTSGAYNEQTLPQNVWVKVSSEFVIPSGFNSFFCPIFEVTNADGSGTVCDGHLYMTGIVFEDITDSAAAKVFAEASSSSASTADTRATDAGNSAVAAQSAETNAGIHEGNSYNYSQSSLSQATIATGAATAASLSAQLSSTVAFKSDNVNPAFGAWTNSATTPDAWAYWETGGTVARIAGPRGGFAARISATSGVNTGFYQGIAPTSAGFRVVEVQFKLVSGTLRGAGVHHNTYAADGTTFQTSDTLQFEFDKDATNNVRGSGEVGKVYTFSKLMDFSAYPNIAISNLYMMANWDGMGTRDAKVLDIYYCIVRPATAEEIRAGTVIPALQSTVAIQAGTIAEVSGRVAGYLGFRVGAGDVVTAVELMTEGGGTPVSKIKLTAATTEISGNTLTDGVIGNTDGSVGWDVATGINTIIEGSYRKMTGAGFGLNGDLLEWWGLNSVAVGQETKANAVFALPTDGKVYLGTPLAGAGAPPAGGGGLDIFNITGNNAAPGNMFIPVTSGTIYFDGEVDGSNDASGGGTHFVELLDATGALVFTIASFSTIGGDSSGVSFSVSYATGVSGSPQQWQIRVRATKFGSGNANTSVSGIWHQ